MAEHETAWERVGYPEGEATEHEHGRLGGVGHSHAGGDVPHKHTHRALGAGRFQDTYQPVSGD